MLMPSASRQSAAPDFDEAARLPCFAGGGDEEGGRRRDVDAARVVAACADDLEDVQVVLDLERVIAHGGGGA